MIQDTSSTKEAGLPFSPKIVIIKTHRSEKPSYPEPCQEGALAYISIGAGETHVTLLDEEGVDICSWTAVAGWSALFSIPVGEISGVSLRVSSEEGLEEAFSGSICSDSGQIDTIGFISASVIVMRKMLCEVIQHTLSLEACSRTIVLSAPPWLHGCLKSCIPSLVGDFHPEILDRF